MRKKPLLCAAVTAGLLAGLCVTPAFAAGEDWKEPYRSAISQNADSFGNVLQLVDLDLDGTPELLMGGAVGSGLFSNFQYGFTMENGTLKTLSVNKDKFLGDEYTLYRNNSTGAYRIESPFTLRAGAGYYSTMTASYTLANGAVDYRIAFGSGAEGNKNTYFGSDGNETTASGYNSTKNAWYNGWTKVGGFQCAQDSKSLKKFTAKEISAFLDSYKAGPVLAKASTHKIQVNGTPVDIGAYGIGGNNYFKLRDVAMLLKDTQGKFQVGFDDATKKITLTTGESYTAVGGELAARDTVNRFGNPTASDIFVDGQAVDLAAYNIGGNNYFKLRDLGSALGFAVTWDEASRTVNITTAK